ncbi:MAG: hypothetical protein HQK99_06580 [Nitrospirae bacterium]|nr:hypothetical protein [Nitrospirota bacterium]
MSVIAIPKSLREKLGDEATEDLVKIINEADLSSRKDLVTKADLEAAKSELLKWSFIFWVSQIGILIAALKFFVK